MNTLLTVEELLVDGVALGVLLRHVLALFEANTVPEGAPELFSAFAEASPKGPEAIGKVSDESGMDIKEFLGAVPFLWLLAFLLSLEVGDCLLHFQEGELDLRIVIPVSSEGVTKHREAN